MSTPGLTCLCFPGDAGISVPNLLGQDAGGAQRAPGAPQAALTAGGRAARRCTERQLAVRSRSRTSPCRAGLCDSRAFQSFPTPFLF